MNRKQKKNVKEEDVVSAYVKPIQATPALSGDDAVSIIKQVLKAPSAERVEKNKAMLEMRKCIEKK